MQLANLTTGVILARALGPADRGEVAALMAVVISVTVLTGFSFGEAFVYWLSRNKTEHKKYAGAGIIIALLTGCLGTVVLALFLPIMTRITGISANGLWPWLLYPLAYQMATASLSLARGSNLHSRWAFLRITTTANYAILLACFALFQNLSIIEINIAAVGGLALSALFGFILLAKAVPTISIDRSAIFNLGLYAAKLHPAIFSALAREQFDKIVLFFLVPASDLGLYVVGIALGLLPVAAANTIDQVMFPSLVAITDIDSRREACLKQIRILGFLMICMFAIAIPLTPIAIKILFGAEYIVNIGIPMAAVAVGFLQSIKIVFNIGLKAEFRPGILGINELIGVATSFSLIFPLVWWLGIFGAPLASGIGGLLALSLTIRAIAQHYEVPLSAVVLPHKGDLTVFVRKLLQRGQAL